MSVGKQIGIPVDCFKFSLASHIHLNSQITLQC